MAAGIVVIGRNEGARLATCLRSVAGQERPVVYVDSGSTDGSPALARSLGVDVLELDPGRPFSAARGRNEGFDRITAGHPEVDRVQFVDGDCELLPGWLARAGAALDARADVAVVCGRIRERHPEASVYNRLCALEWQQPAGEVNACGGIFMVRAAAFRAVGGFRGDVPAGEEPELCLRLRRNGGKILSLEDEMVWHDSAMLRLGQWWRRVRRGGQGYAQGAAMHGGRGGLYVKERRSALLWGLALPAAALLMAWPTSGWSLLLLLAYPLQIARIAWRARRRWTARDALLYAAFTVLAKLPEAQGVLGFHWTRMRGRSVALIDKPAAPPAG